MDRESKALMLGTQVALQALIAVMYRNEQTKSLIVESKKLALSTAAMADSNEYKGTINSDIELVHQVVELTFSQVR